MDHQGLGEKTLRNNRDKYIDASAVWRDHEDSLSNFVFPKLLGSAAGNGQDLK